MYEYELYHHGIRGQKWGVRRFQSENGTLNDKGRARKAKLERKIYKQEHKAEKYSNKLEKDTRKYASKIAYYKRKSASAASTGTNLLLKKTAYGEAKRNAAAKYSGKAARLESKLYRSQGKIEGAKRKVARYNKQLSKLPPEKISKGKAAVARKKG